MIRGPERLHSWSGAHGVPGGLARWEPGSYRWRRGVEVAALIVALVLLAPWTLEVVAGAAPLALGLLWLAWGAHRRCRRRRFDVLALLLAAVALLEARKRPADP